MLSLFCECGNGNKLMSNGMIQFEQPGVGQAMMPGMLMTQRRRICCAYVSARLMGYSTGSLTRASRARRSASSSSTSQRSRSWHRTIVLSAIAIFAARAMHRTQQHMCPFEHLYILFCVWVFYGRADCFFLDVRVFFFCWQ